jgi:glycosyltransferase involved in cell wall biosynthesis
MHIGINALLLSYSHTYRNGGVSHYIRYLLTELAQQDSQHHYTVFVNGPGVIEKLEAHQSHITFVGVSWPESQPAIRVAWEQFVLPSLLRQKNIDVLHSPVNVLPATIPGNCATVITLHDLAFLRFPELLTRAKRVYHNTFTIRSMKRATQLITVSDSTKHDAFELAHIPTERMQTVYPCIDEHFSNVVDSKKISQLCEQHGLSEGFILYLGTLEPRKNLPMLIEAYHHLRQQHNIRQKLVIAGGKGWYYDAIFTKVQELGLQDVVLFPGFIADDDRALWYQAASVFAYPSLYEGFGLPVSEALASGTPVVTSDVSSMPEAGADVALCVNPRDVVATSHALQRALTDEQLHARCRSEAPTIAQHFSARIMVEQTIRVYEKAAHTLQQSSQHMAFIR